MVTNPLVIMPSSTGKNESIFSGESTISTTTGKSCERRKIFVVWMRLECPKSDMPAQHGRSSDVHFSRFQYNRLMQRQVIKSMILAKEDSEQDGIA